MKLLIAKVASPPEVPESQIELFLELTPHGDVLLSARNLMDDCTRTLLKFSTSGVVYKIGTAEIGDFMFDYQGRIVIND